RRVGGEATAGPHGAAGLGGGGDEPGHAVPLPFGGDGPHGDPVLEPVPDDAGFVEDGGHPLGQFGHLVGRGVDPLEGDADLPAGHEGGLGQAPAHGLVDHGVVEKKGGVVSAQLQHRPLERGGGGLGG